MNTNGREFDDFLKLCRDFCIALSLSVFQAATGHACWLWHNTSVLLTWSVDTCAFLHSTIYGIVVYGVFVSFTQPLVSQFCWPRGMSLLSGILKDQFTSSCPWTTSAYPCPWTKKVLENCQELCILQTVRCGPWFGYYHRTWGYGEEALTDHCVSLRKPFFTETQCCCSRGKSLFSRTNLQVLGLQVHVLGPSPCPRTLSPWQHDC